MVTARPPARLAHVSDLPHTAPALPPPNARARLAAALAVAAAAGLYAGVCLATRGVASDFEVWWHAARLLARGVDPYLLGPGAAEWPFDGWLFYPLPALFFTLPVAGLPMPVAGAALLAAAAGALAWALTAHGWWRLWLLASPGFIMALKVGQWSPLLTAAALLPALGAFAAVKPTLGLAALAYRADPRAVLLAGGTLALSVLVLPAWPREWLANLAHVGGHPAPAFTWAGAPLLLALLRWRRPEARLLAAMACVPQLLFFADQLAVGLVARSAREAKLLSGCGMAAWALWFATVDPRAAYVPAAAPWVLAGVYLPALTLVLLRPNAAAAS